MKFLRRMLRRYRNQCVNGMKDYEFLEWVHDRLELVYGENPFVDYMHRLRDISKELKRVQTGRR